MYFIKTMLHRHGQRATGITYRRLSDVRPTRVFSMSNFCFCKSFFFFLSPMWCAESWNITENSLTNNFTKSIISDFYPTLSYVTHYDMDKYGDCLYRDYVMFFRTKYFGFNTSWCAYLYFIVSKSVLTFQDQICLPIK